jgi:hypothetical protein
MNIDTDFDDYSSDDYLDDGSVSNLSDHFRGFSFWKEDVSSMESIDRDDMFAFLIEMGLDPSRMSNDDIVKEFNAIIDGDSDLSDEADDEILLPDMDELGE